MRTFDGPVFRGNEFLIDGWCNVRQFSKLQTIGCLWGTREEAELVAVEDVIYRIRVKVKPQWCKHTHDIWSDHARDSF